MNIVNAHERYLLRPPSEVFCDLVALGTAADRIWPEPKIPFQRTDGPMLVGITHEQHGAIRAVLETYEVDKQIVWGVHLPFLRGTHSFEVQEAGDTATLAGHVIRAKLAWWFVPVWWLYVRHVHNRIIEGLLDRLADGATQDA